jgi:hypothetical protein
MKRRILAVALGSLSAIGVGMLLGSISLNKTIIPIGLIGGFITGIIAKEKGYLYGLIPGIFWDIYHYVRWSMRVSKQMGRLVMPSLSGIFMDELVTGLLVQLLILGALGGALGGWIAKRLASEKEHPC